MIYQDSIDYGFSTDGLKWNAENLYSVIFNWASIQSGFVFAIYGFIVTKRDGFAEHLIGGQTFDRFLSFTKRACFGGFALTLCTMPLVVVSPDIKSASPSFIPIALCFSLFIWAFFAFLRVAFSFGIIVATHDKPKRIVG